MENAERIGCFITGAIAMMVSLIVIANIADRSSRDVCKAQNWSGAGCQCRVTLGYDKPSGKE